PCTGGPPPARAGPAGDRGGGSAGDDARGTTACATDERAAWRGRREPPELVRASCLADRLSFPRSPDSAVRRRPAPVAVDAGRGQPGRDRGRGAAAPMSSSEGGPLRVQREGPLAVLTFDS